MEENPSDAESELERDDGGEKHFSYLAKILLTIKSSTPEPSATIAAPLSTWAL